MGTAAKASPRFGTRRFTEDRHPLWIAAKSLNVFPHPAQRRDLIEHRVVAVSMMLRLGGQLRKRKNSSDNQPVIYAHQHHALLGQYLPVRGRNPTDAPGEAPPLNPKHDRA